MIRKLLTKLMFGTPVRGDKIYKTKKKTSHTVMPCENMSLIKWYRGGFSKFWLPTPEFFYKQKKNKP